MSDCDKNSITLPGAMAMGTSVMIGAGVVVDLLVAFAVGSSLPLDRIVAAKDHALDQRPSGGPAFI